MKPSNLSRSILYISEKTAASGFKEVIQAYRVKLVSEPYSLPDQVHIATLLLQAPKCLRFP